MGYASFLQQEAQGEMSEHAAAVLNSALHMRSLIEDMTNLRFLELGESELQLEPMSVTQLIELTKSDVLDIAVAKGHTVTFAPVHADINMRVDRGKLVMALGNLLNNAIKFTPPQNGKILVECRQHEHENELWIQVTDNGVGIPEDDMQDIFRPFHQVEDHMTRHHGGMGLGLSIAKSVIEAHRGRIWAESPGPNQGSTFTVALPIPPAAY
jgi:signal transduction histidine kinase